MQSIQLENIKRQGGVMGYGIAPNSSHFTGKKKSKHKHIKVRKNKRVHKNKYAREESEKC